MFSPAVWPLYWYMYIYFGPFVTVAYCFWPLWCIWPGVEAPEVAFAILAPLWLYHAGLAPL